MSDILEALRKVELQRNNSKVPGITTRQRYYTAQGRRGWPRPLMVVAATLIGASLTGGVAAYLAHQDGVVPAVAKRAEAEPHANALPKPVAASVASREPPVASPVGAVRAAPQQTALQAVRPAPLRLPGPRQPHVTAAQSAQPSATPPSEEEPEQTPAEEIKPESQPPEGSDHEQGTAVAGQPPRPEIEKAAPPQAVAEPPERTAYSRIPSPAEALDKIRPPHAVEVKPYRPNDVLRPPVARKSPASSDPPLLSTLSSQFQSMVPKMVINAQVYSANQKQRFVVINMRRYNEGQSTIEGVAIESIRQNDIIFVYQGQRFRLGR